MSVWLFRVCSWFGVPQKIALTDVPISEGKWHGEEEAKSDNVAPAEPVKLFREASEPWLVAVKVRVPMIAKSIML